MRRYRRNSRGEVLYCSNTSRRCANVCEHIDSMSLLVVEDAIGMRDDRSTLFAVTRLVPTFLVYMSTCSGCSRRKCACVQRLAHQTPNEPDSDLNSGHPSRCPTRASRGVFMHDIFCFVPSPLDRPSRGSLSDPPNTAGTGGLTWLPTFPAEAMISILPGVF